jgi:hypothetical protein
MKHINLFEKFINEKFKPQDVEEIFFIWDENVDDGRENIESGRTTHKGKLGNVFHFEVSNLKPGEFESFENAVRDYLEKNGFEFEMDSESLFVYESQNANEAKEEKKEKEETEEEEPEPDAKLTPSSSIDYVKSYMKSHKMSMKDEDKQKFQEIVEILKDFVKERKEMGRKY